MVIAALLPAACGAEGPPRPKIPAVREAVAPAPVVVGEWTIDPAEGRATRPGWEGNARVHVTTSGFMPGGLTHTRELVLPGGTSVEAFAGDLRPTEQSSLPPRNAAANLLLVCDLPDGESRLHVWGGRLLEPVEARTWEAFGAAERELLQRAVDTAEEFPSFDLLLRLIEKRIVLSSDVVVAHPPAGSASVEGGPFEPLRGRETYRLPARPGQSVVLRFEAEAIRRTVTSLGIEEAPADLTETDARVLADTGWARFDADGVCELGPIVPESPRALRLVADYAPGVSQELTVLLRWGRPEEAWLDRPGGFPTVPALTDATDEACVGSLLADLEASFAPNPDFGTVPEIRSRTSLRALDGLDLTGYPRLLALRDGSPATQVPARFEVAVRLFAEPGEWPVARPLETPDLPGTGWHSPEVVHWLAVLAERDGSPEARRRLEAVLDLWARAIPERPDPVERSGKSGPVPDRSLASRLFAVAALQRGCRMFGKPEYAAARDREMSLLRESLAEKGRLEAIRGARRFSSRSSERPLYDLTLYAQACVAAGDEAGLAEAKDWIRAALRRDGGTAGPFGLYRGAPVDDRLDLLAVMRGRATWLEPPRR